MEEHVQASRSSLFDLYPRAALHSARRLAVWSCFLHNAATGRSRGRRRRTRTLHICKTEGTWKLMLMTGTAAARDCLDVAGRNFCFLVSWPQEGRQALEDGCERRGEERKEAYLPSEAELSRLRAGMQPARSKQSMGEIGDWTIEFVPTGVAAISSRHDTCVASEQSSTRRCQVARGTDGVGMLLLTEGGGGIAASHPTW